MDFNQNHFELFGLPQRYPLDAAALDAAYRDIQARIHPDRFAQAGDAEKRLSMQWATRVNEAYQTLKKPFDRALYLLHLRGIDALAPGNTAMPPEFLMRQMDWREALAEARQTASKPGLTALEQELDEYAAALESALATQLDEHDDAAAAENLRKLRFMHKLREELDAAQDELL